MLLEEMKLRKQQYGYSNHTIAEMSGVPVSTVQKVFGGFTKPRQSTLEKLTTAFSKLDASGKSAGLHNLRETSGYVAGTSARSFSETDGQKRTSLDCFPGKKQGEFTLDDYYALPDDIRTELIDGAFYDILSAPNWIHQTILLSLATMFKTKIKERKGPCKVFVAPCDVQICKDDKNMVEPDLFIVCDMRDQKDIRLIYGAPDFTLEILSPSTRSHDMVRKLNKYMDAGVREYWIVDPEKKQVYTYDFENNIDYNTYSFQDTIPVAIYHGEIQIEFSEILEELIEIYGENF
ncbi:MAG: Uma2 family endonuclease [Lachnospiraceae bacterium]|nr:Uma2 family endonuclease [Lachnospiraceae bacterium]